MKYLPFIFFLIFSCSSKKDILLIQDTNNLSQYKLNFDEIIIKPDDILRIKISSKSPELSGLYSFNQPVNNVSSIQNEQINGFLVNSDGFVKIPMLKPILVKGLSLNQASDLIQQQLTESGELINSSVDVKIMNAYFTVLGEVNIPGRYNFIENNMDILQAIGIAGDFTINGKRDNIKILRKKDSILTVNSIDLTSSKLLSSKFFQIFPGDIIIINPNQAKIKNAGIIGNFGNLLSVLSFILSSIILISN